MNIMLQLEKKSKIRERETNQKEKKMEGLPIIYVDFIILEIKSSST